MICYNLLLGVYEADSEIFNKEFNLAIKINEDKKLLGEIAVKTESKIWQMYLSEKRDKQLELYNSHI